MRIVSVCRTLPNPDSPGAGVFVLERLRAMARTTQLRVLQPVPYMPGLRPLPPWAGAATHEARGVTIAHQPMFYIPGVLKSLDGRWLARAVYPRLYGWHQESPIDLIDAHFGYPEGVGCVLAAQRLNVPVFVTVRGLETDRVRIPRIGPQLVKALNQATGCVSVSHSLRDLMVSHGVAADRMEVIPNAINRASFRPSDRGAARAALRIGAGERLIVSVGHLISGKRHNVVLQALSKLYNEVPGVTLAIVGGADYEPRHPAYLHALARQLGVADRVRFVGAVPPQQVAEWLRAADVFALGTAREGCCNAVLEALATGVPVVTTPVGDNANYVIDGVNGFLVPVNDTEAMATALRAALEIRWDAREISAGLNAGDWQDVAERVLSFFADRLRACRDSGAVR